MKNNQCETVVYIKDGIPVTRKKKKFDTLDDAIKECKKLNLQEHRIHKLVSYKCSICHKYHIGRNGKLIKRK